MVRQRRLARGEEVTGGMLSVRDVVNAAREREGGRGGEEEGDEEKGYKGEEGKEPLIDKKEKKKKKKKWYGSKG
jgi:hypothetical protein